MAINPINLQISVPRTPDAANLQQQAMLKPIIDQTELAQQSIKHTEYVRTQVQKTNEIEKGLIQDEHHSQSQQQQQNKRNKKQKNMEDKSLHHPYKGHSIDIKL